MSGSLRDRVVAAVGDRYLVEIELGRGAASVVYRATDAALKRRVALKVLPPERAADPATRERFRREAEIAARLSHPSIVPIHAVDERDGLAYVVMAYVEGESLEERLARDPRPPLMEVRRILGDIADALAYAHSRGIVHRDVTPGNIMLETDTGRPLLTDFGIARAASEHPRLTAVGIAIGTPAYMAPEQALGDSEVDGRADIYSLGVIGWQMVAGSAPFESATTLGMLMKQVAEPVPSLVARRPDVPGEMAAAIERALAKAPDDRWSDAAMFRDALRGATMATARVPDAPAPVPTPRSGERAAIRPSAWPPGYVPLRSHARAEAHAPAHDALDARAQIRIRLEEEEDVRLWGRLTSIGERARAFRRAFLVTAGISSLVVFTPEFPPFVVLPVYTLISSFGLRRRMRSLRSEGLRIRDVLRGRIAPAFDRASHAGSSSGAAGRQADQVVAVRSLVRGHIAPAARDRVAIDEIARLAPRDVLEGPYGEQIRQAASDRVAIREAIGKLDTVDREMLPDIEPTVTALVDRVASLAQTMHRLDSGLSVGLSHEIGDRLAAVRREPASDERDRRVALLERQEETVRDLEARRSALASRLDSAGMALRTLRLDLVRLRASGVGASIDEVSHATQEARALSRDIAVALEAARDLRAI